MGHTLRSAIHSGTRLVPLTKPDITTAVLAWEVQCAPRCHAPSYSAVAQLVGFRVGQSASVERHHGLLGWTDACTGKRLCDAGCAFL